MTRLGGAMRWPWLVAAATLALFLAVSLRHLDSVPQVYEDEPWQASTAYKLAQDGVFGSNLFAGFFHMDQRYYGFMPLHPFVLAADFKLFGAGLLQARVATVLLSATTLILTFALGVRLFNAGVAALAVTLLVVVRWTGLTYVQPTGIPLIDFARIARYDPLVPVLGLSAMHAYLWTRRHAQRQWLLSLMAGLLAGLAGLAHVYGLFWVIALLALSAWDGQRRSLVFIAAGALLPWLPYAAYVAGDLTDWRGQTAIYASRFELATPAWYVANIAQEYHRYGPGLGPIGPSWLARPGFWAVAVGLPIALALLLRQARSDASARAIVVPGVAFPILFATFITLKLVNYTLIELPVFALALAWGAQRLWCTWSTVRGVRALLAAVGLAMLVEGGFALTQIERAAASATPYPVLAARLRAHLPTGARILGLHTYWFGLEDFDYRSFLVPLNLADEGVPLDHALDQVAPDIVLLDRRMRQYFDSPAVVADHDRFYGWLMDHEATPIDDVDDPTYGRIQVYQLKR